MKVRVIRSIREVTAETWDSFSGDDPVFSHAWFQLLEETLPKLILPRHLILEERGRILGILPCFIQYDDPYFTLSERLFGRFHGWLARLGIRVLPALLAYSPLAHRSRLLLDASVDRALAVRLWSEAMRQICKEERLPVSGWIFASGWDRNLIEAARTTGHTEAFLAPTAVWINRFNRFEEYLEQFKSISRHHYKKMRNEINRSVRSAVVLEEKPLNFLDNTTLQQMHQTQYAVHYPARPSPLSESFFAALKAAFGDRVAIHTAVREGECVSYSAVIKSGSRWHMFINGDAPGELSRADKLLFRLNYYYPIERAIEEKAPRLDYGLAAYELKAQRGCDMEPLHMALRAHTRWLFWLPAWLNVVDKWYRYKHRHVPSMQPVAEPKAEGKKSFPRRIKDLWFERRTFLLTAAPIANGDQRQFERTDVQVSPLTADELVLIRPTASKSRWKLFLRFQQEGYLCYGAWMEQKLVGYMWVTNQKRAWHFSGFFGKIPLKASESFIAYTYVWPQWRGRRIAPLLKEFVSGLLAAEGVSVIYSGVINSNESSLKSNVNWGAAAVRLWIYQRFGIFHKKQSLLLAYDHPLARLFGEGKISVHASPELAGTAASAARKNGFTQRFLSRLKEQGFGKFMRKAARDLRQRAYESGIIYDLRIPLQGIATLKLPRIRQTPSIRRLNVCELERLRPISSKSLYRFLEGFQRQGFRCYIAEVGGEIAAYNWYTDQPYYSPVTGLTYPLGPDELFLVFSYAPRQWRGKGIDTVLKVHTYRELQQEGFRAVRTIIDQGNRTSLRMVPRFGGSLVQQYHYQRIFGFRKAAVTDAVSPAELTKHAGPVRTLLSPQPGTVILKEEIAHANN